MRKLNVWMLLTALMLCLSSCQKWGATERYERDHDHTYGAYYTVKAVTCQADGQQVRYCSICRQEEVSTVSVATDMDARAHDFSYTVVEPTESEWGYTVKCCNACGYTVDRCEEKPPLYLLLSGVGMQTQVPVGVAAALRADTESHLLSLAANRDAVVDADIARRLGVALTVTELVESGLLSEEIVVTVKTGGLAGRTYTLRQLIVAFVKNGADDAALALADACGDDAAAFEARVRMRMERLGLQGTTEIHPVSAQNASKTTLYDTAVLLARALDTPLIVEALNEGVPDLSQIAGQTPAVWLVNAAGTLRVTALQTAQGEAYDFLLLFGPALPEGAEEQFFARN